MSEESILSDDEILSAQIQAEELEKPSLDDIAVEIKDDSSLKGEDASVIVEEPKNAVDESIEAIKKNLEEERKLRQTAEESHKRELQARQEAERRAEEAQSNVTQSQTSLYEANKIAANNAIATATSELEKYRREAAELQANGKFEEAEDVRLKAFESKQQIKDAQSYIANLERVPQQRNITPQGYKDPVTGNLFTERTGKWIQEHSDVWNNEDSRAEVFGYDAMARAKGIHPDTPAYFEFIESRLKPAETIVSVEPTRATAAKKPSGASLGASPTRAVAGTQRVSRDAIKVTGGQREIMESITESLKDYFPNENPDQLAARSIKQLIKEKGEDWATNFNRQ